MSTYGFARKAVDRNGHVVSQSCIQWGLLFLFWERVYQYDLNEVPSFAPDIYCTSPLGELANKPLRPKTSNMWSCGALGEGQPSV